MGLLGQQTWTVTRTDGEHSDAGEWAPNAPTTFSVDGTLIPITGRELLQLPEGQRSSANYSLFTESGDLRVADPATGAQADQVERKGVQLLVTNRDDMSDVGMRLAHYEYILTAPGLPS